MKFRVAGTPAPQGSKRHVGGGRMVEMSKAVGPWREAVRAEAQRACGTGAPPLSLPVSVTVVFIRNRPQSHYRTGQNAHLLRDGAPPFPAARRRWDLDKLVRAVFDGLTDGGAVADDSLIVSLNAAKVYARDGEAPGAIIEVEAMT